MATMRAVGFDLDGTLFDHRGSARTAVDTFARHVGIEPTETAREDWFAAEAEQFERWRSGEISFVEQRRERLRAVLPRWDASVPEDDAALDALFEHYLSAYRSGWRTFSDSATLLESLRTSGFRIGILTNGSEQQQVDKLASLSLLDAVDVVCTSERIGVAKPTPEAFLTLVHELGVEPAECLFVGDSVEHDVVGAESVGMQALLVDRYGVHAEGIMAAVVARLGISPHDGYSAPDRIGQG